MSSIIIRPAAEDDAAAIWAILQPVIASGESYALPRNLERDAALAFWMAPSHEVFVAEDEAEIVGTYFIRANQAGPGGHVANCGYITPAPAEGRGVAGAMCAHSLARARARDFRAMQYNLAVSTNDRAIRLWQRYGFEIAGRLPGAFAHPTLGFVDAFVMYRTL
jgi:ribosomal protein S18 acetylase RimI-like enzyme